jgi:cell wall-associated NlpC family hydrolase
VVPQAVEPPLGSVGMTQIHGPVGLGIRLGQWANGSGFEDFEHVVIYIGNGLIVEAEPGGARIAELSEYNGDTIVWLHCPPQYGQAVADAARALVGTPYSFLDYDALALHRLHIPAPGLRNYISASGHAICSQLADIAAQRGGWELFDDGRWPGYVVPGDIYRLWLAQNAPAPLGA